MSLSKGTVTSVTLERHICHDQRGNYVRYVGKIVFISMLSAGITLGCGWQGLTYKAGSHVHDRTR